MFEHDAEPLRDALPASSLSCLAFLEGQRQRDNEWWGPSAMWTSIKFKRACVPVSRWSAVMPAMGGGACVKRSFDQAARLHHVAGGQGEPLKLRGGDQVEAWCNHRINRWKHLFLQQQLCYYFTRIKTGWQQGDCRDWTSSGFTSVCVVCAKPAVTTLCDLSPLLSISAADITTHTDMERHLKYCWCIFLFHHFCILGLETFKLLFKLPSSFSLY